MPRKVMLLTDGVNVCSDELMTTISTSENNVTTTQFLSWDPKFIGLCDNMTAHGKSPPASNATTNAGSQQRGGGDGSGTVTGSGGVGGPARNSTIVKPGALCPSRPSLEARLLVLSMPWPGRGMAATPSASSSTSRKSRLSYGIQFLESGPRLWRH